MRHPTTGLSEDDLSRLTGSSSSTASSGSHQSSSSSSSSASNTPAHQHNHLQHQQQQQEGLVIGDGVVTQHSLHQLQHQHQSTPEKSTTQSTLKSNTNSNINVTNNNNNNNNNNHNNNNGNGNGKNSHHINTNTTQVARFSSTYLPEIINPLEWQKSRKRKERLDSTSSATDRQDRKLQRSNSEELLPQDAAADSNDVPAAVGGADGANVDGGNALKANRAVDVIRRVSSEDFKKTSYTLYEQELKETDEHNNSINNDGLGNNNDDDKHQQQNQQQPQQQSSQQQQIASDENDASLANRQSNDMSPPPIYGETWMTRPMKDMVRRSRYETSPARSQRHSPIRSNGKYSDDSECENERRRSSERFAKTRGPPGRKAAGVSKKSGSGGSGSSSGGKYLPAKRGDETSYKYDLSSLKNERRGFISKKVNSTADKNAGGGGDGDLNDNNLIDFQQKKTTTTPVMSPVTPEVVAVPTNNLPLTSAEALPWDRSVPEDQTPMLSRRYSTMSHYPAADSIDTAAKLAKVMPYPQQQYHKQMAAQMLADDMDCMEPLDTYRVFSSLENMRTRDVMQQIIPAMMSFQSPEERLKQVNKRITALKKKLMQLEEAFETRMGYRPSQAERLNDKYMKHILSELNKLRKERHELKLDPMGALGMKCSGDMDSGKKLDQVKNTLQEIEKNLTDKRVDARRPDALDEMTPEQLLQEKSAVQHGLLYFESLYGHPGTKDERDAARPLYDRYRQLKRSVSRSVLLSGSNVAGAPELPTILEHEAMVFEATPQQYSSNNSTDTTNSPSDSVPPTGSSDDSTTTTTTTTTAANVASSASAQESESTTTAGNAYENVSAFSIEQLWQHLDKTREEKKLLKRTIREYETVFEEQNGRKMLKNDRKNIEETYAQYKEKKAKARLLQALIKKQISR